MGDTCDIDFLDMENGENNKTHNNFDNFDNFEIDKFDDLGCENQEKDEFADNFLFDDPTPEFKKFEDNVERENNWENDLHAQDNDEDVEFVEANRIVSAIKNEINAQFGGLQTLVIPTPTPQTPPTRPIFPARKRDPAIVSIKELSNLQDKGKKEKKNEEEFNVYYKNLDENKKDFAKLIESSCTTATKDKNGNFSNYLMNEKKDMIFTKLNFNIILRIVKKKLNPYFVIYQYRPHCYINKNDYEKMKKKLSEEDFAKLIPINAINLINLHYIDFLAKANKLHSSQGSKYQGNSLYLSFGDVKMYVIHSIKTRFNGTPLFSQDYIKGVIENSFHEVIPKSQKTLDQVDSEFLASFLTPELKGKEVYFNLVYLKTNPLTTFVTRSTYNTKINNIQYSINFNAYYCNINNGYGYVLAPRKKLTWKHKELNAFIIPHFCYCYVE